MRLRILITCLVLSLTACAAYCRRGPRVLAIADKAADVAQQVDACGALKDPQAQRMCRLGVSLGRLADQTTELVNVEACAEIQDGGAR